MTEQRKNSYEDSDLKKILEEIDDFEDQKLTIMAEAAGKCSGIAKRIANAKKTAKALGIPKASLNALLKVRKLERKIIEATEDIPADEVEIFEDMTSGQFSFLAPEDGEDEAPAHVAARKHKTAAQKNEEAEQEAGAEVLSKMAETLN